MHNFEKLATTIIAAAKEYGVTIALAADKNLQFTGEHKGSESVEKWLQRKITTYNGHVVNGF